MRKVTVNAPLWFRGFSNLNMLDRRRYKQTLARTFPNYAYHLLAHIALAGLLADVFQGDGALAGDADGAVAGYGAVHRNHILRRAAVTHGERHRFGVPVHGRPHPVFVAAFLGRLEGGHQGHCHAAGGVGAGDGAGPQPGDDGSRAAVGQRSRRVEVSNFGVCHRPHFAPVITNIGGQAGGAAPGRPLGAFALADG